MNRCERCGSYALNANRGDPDGLLCDVCYWKGQAMVARAERDEAREAARWMRIYLPVSLEGQAVKLHPWLEEEK